MSGEIKEVHKKKLRITDNPTGFEPGTPSFLPIAKYWGKNSGCLFQDSTSEFVWKDKRKLMVYFRWITCDP
jgi:hypothetical protein